MYDFDAQLAALKQQLNRLQQEQLLLQESIKDLGKQWEAAAGTSGNQAAATPPLETSANPAGVSAGPSAPGEASHAQPSGAVTLASSASSSAAVNTTTARAAGKRINEKQSGHSLEDFIGTNLISKIGILITIIGIFIGAKYAIDKDLVSPAVRIAGGYCSALILVAIGLWLKARYAQFSAVLVGGGIAVAYFITYSAFSFYHLLSQPLAFVCMLLTTVAAVALALWYNQQVIALLGQVAAYAIPLLLSDGTGNIAVMFTYIALINAGLMYLSFHKDWKLLYRLAFIITWAMYAYWIFIRGGRPLPYVVGLSFLSVQFLTFYCTFLSYKVFKKVLYQRAEVAVLLINALLYFGLGFGLTQINFAGVNGVTAFTIANAAIHFLVGYFVYKARLADKSVKEFLIGLGLLFLSIAIPVKLDGSWVTLAWSLEAVMLTVVAIRTQRTLYFDMALPVMAIAVVGLVGDLFMGQPALWERYMEMAGIGWACVMLERGTRMLSVPADNIALLSLAFQVLLLTCICNEYLYWVTFAGFRNEYKLGLSLIWAFYALIVLFLGLIRNKKHWRIWAIAIFSCTIIKLFAYDLASLSTIAKTIVMVFTGIILLIASFLYNKYKDVLLPKDADNNGTP